MLKVQALGKSYGKQNVLINFNLEVQNGEIISLLGSSGSGKTTFLRLVAGLEIPDSGQIILNEKFVNDKNTFVRPERRDCSLVFQDYALFPNMSVHENIFFGKNSDQNKKKIEQLIKITDIEKIMNKFPHQCSGGEQQRVALVRSLAVNPSLVLMDEPLSNLDYNLKTNLGALIRKLLKEFKTTAVIVTHDISDAMEISDKIAIIDEGTVVQEGSPDEVYTNPKSKKIALLFGETNFIPLKIFPESQSHFYDSKTKEDWISIRPDQFAIFDEKNSKGKKFFSGKIKFIRKIGSRSKIELKCDNISLNISLNTYLNLSVGEKLKVIVL